MNTSTRPIRSHGGLPLVIAVCLSAVIATPALAGGRYYQRTSYRASSSQSYSRYRAAPRYSNVRYYDNEPVRRVGGGYQDSAANIRPGSLTGRYGGLSSSRQLAGDSRRRYGSSRLYR